MANNILITGGTGFLGTKIIKELLKSGHEVSLLSRKPATIPDVKTYIWDIEKGEIDKNCLEGIDTIIHLAGAGIADEKWTNKRKDILIKSRTASIKLIYDLMKSVNHEVKSVISASAAGYYSDRGDELLNENEIPNTDFLAKCCVLWEQAVDEGKDLGLRIVKLRTGVIFDNNKGALPKLSLPIKFWLGSALGNGKQWVSWIHIKDAVNMYLFAVKNDHISGVFNMSSPQPITNKELIKAIAKQLGKPLWAPAIPSFVLRLLLGEMSSVILGSTRMDVSKIQNAGFEFKHPTIESALKEIYG